MKTRSQILEYKVGTRGLNEAEWEELKDIRKERILARGGNPDHYELGSRSCELSYSGRKLLGL
tara:strand:+ start:512 stop:700 length:189 start_codon:yes stop_codon:yes gene_type:complete